MLGEQARGVHGLGDAAGLPRGLELEAQRGGAAVGAGGQFVQPRQGARRVVVVQRPAGGAQQHAFAQFGGGAAAGGGVQRLVEMLVARGLVLQGVRAFGDGHVGQRAQGQRVRRRVAGALQRLLARQRAFGRLASAQESAGAELREGVEQHGMRGALALLGAPAARLTRQLKHRRQRAQRQVQQHEQADQQQQRQIDRQIDPVRRPEHGDGAFVVARKQRQRDRRREQADQPQGSAHGCGLAAPRRVG